MSAREHRPLPTPVRVEEPLALRLRVARVGEPERDVVVESDPAVPVGRVLTEIERCLDGAAARGTALRLHSPRMGRDLDAEIQIAACGLVQGDRLTIVDVGGNGAAAATGAEAETGAVARMTVHQEGAPDREVRLEAGVHVVGRSDESDLVIDDEQVSREHLRITVGTNGVTVKDLGSSNGTRIDGARIADERPLAPAQPLEIGQTRIELVELRVPRSLRAVGGMVPFNRPPRIAQPGLGSSPSLPAPPPAPTRSRVPLSAALAPLALGVAMYLITGSVATLLFLALSPIIAVWSLVEDRRGGKRDHKREAARWRAGLGELVASIAVEREKEDERRHAEAPTLDLLRDVAVERGSTLWLRRPSNDDFLRLRLGTADLASLVQPVMETGGSDALRAEAEAALAAGRTRIGVPATLALGTVHVAGLCGPEGSVHALGRALVAQAAALHAPGDLTIAAAISEDAAPSWEWLKWLPHSAQQDGEPVPLALGLPEARTLLDAVLARIDARVADAEQRFGTSGGSGPRLLLVLDEQLGLPRSMITSILERAGTGGVVAIWLGRAQTDLPGSCRAIAAFDAAGATLTLSDVGSGDVIGPIAAEVAGVEEAETIALALAPLRETDARNADASIPRRVRLPPLLGFDEISADDLVSLWGAGANSLAAPLGTAAREPYLFDLRADGPHALIAGTTGSGKSELLQTLVATLAATHSPEQLTLLLIDYKGGAAFKDCVHLPHTVGFFTDLDASLANRALASLVAELRRREEILRRHGAKDLLDLEGRGGPTPPSLLIVIDEFATLVSEVPEFVDGVVDVARRGRSLGVHLILATQKAAGTIGPNVRANTNLRIALRVQDGSDSDDVIGSSAAARIPPSYSGRAIARIGVGDPIEFQTAYAGAHSAGSRSGDRVAVRRFRFGGPPPRASETIIGAGPTDLERIVRAAQEANERLEIPRQPSPWLAPLPAVLTLDEAGDDEDRPPTAAVIGLLDLPDEQRRAPLLVDLEDNGNLLFFGSGGSGKTSALRSLAVALARTHTPDELHVYALDFATGALRGLDALPHCGAVILKDEGERVERLMRRLTTTIAQRKARPDGAWPRILVLLDDYAGFEAAYERVVAGEMIETFQRLVAEGRPLGVHFAITAGRRAAVPMQLSGSIAWRFVLRQAGGDEYGAFEIPSKALPPDGLGAGRGFLVGDTRVEGQIALVGGDGTAASQASAFREVAYALQETYAGRAPGVGTLPPTVELSELAPGTEALEATLGVGDLHLDRVTVGLDGSHFLVIGPYKAGRSTALGTIAAGLEGAELHLLAARRSPLTSLAIWDTVAEGVEACTESAQRLRESLPARTGADRPMVIVIDNGEEITEGGPAAALEALARQGRDLGVCIVAAVERMAARRAFGGWVVELRKEEHGLLLNPDPDIDGDLLGARLPRNSSRGLPPGRGYLVERGTLELVQVAWPGDPTAA